MNRTAPGEVNRILLMEDDQSVNDVIATLLEKFGFTVLKTATGEEAVTVFRAVRDIGISFHIALLDLHVTSGMGGAETLAALKAIDPSIKAILMSGDKSDPVFRAFNAHGFCSALIKPFDVRDLLDSIQAAAYPRANAVP